MEAQKNETVIPSIPLGSDGYPLNIYRTKLPLSELKEETLKYLTDWKPPPHAYVLFEKRQIHLGQNMKYTAGTGLCCINFEARPEQEQKLNYYVIKKRFRLIDWGNFPKLNDANPARAARARMYSGSDGRNPWDILEQAIISMMQTNPAWKEEKAAMAEREQGFKAKIAEMEKRLKAEENGKAGGGAPPKPNRV